MGAKSLQSLVALGVLSLGGCSSNEVADNRPPIVEQKRVLKPVRHEVISPLRDYIYAQYDESIGKPNSEVDSLSKKLETALLSANLSAGNIELLRNGKSAPELELFFEEQGLMFRRFRFLGQQTFGNYELVRVGPEERKQMALFGITKEYTKVTFTEEFITSSFTYLAQKYSTKITGAVSSSMHGSDRIEYRPWQDESSIRQYFEKMTEMKDVLEKHSSDVSAIRSYLGKGPKLYPAAVEHVGRVLIYKGLRDKFLVSKSVDDFTSKSRDEWALASEISHAMKQIDDFSFDKEVLDKLGERDRTMLTLDKAMHYEIRSLLAQMKHGNSHRHLGDVLKLLSFDKGQNNSPQVVGAKALTMTFFNEIVKNREKFANIDITGYERGKEAVLCYQLVLLSEEQVRDLAQSAFDSIYKGKSLKDYFQPRIEQLLNK